MLEKIITYFEPSDEILLFGFSCGAYTLRAVANVINLCGIPTIMSDGTSVRRRMPCPRKTASDAVHYVYKHGNEKPLGEQPYLIRREILGRWFRQKYCSFVVGAEKDVRGNVQPTFIVIFDTVAALANRAVSTAIFAVFFALIVCCLI